MTEPFHLVPFVRYSVVTASVIEKETKPIYECRCDERLKTRVEESTRLGYTQLVGELEHLKIML